MPLIELRIITETFEKRCFQGFPYAYFSVKKTLKVELVQTCLHNLLKKNHPASNLLPRWAETNSVSDSNKTEEKKIPRGIELTRYQQRSNAPPPLRFSQFRRK